ncbi:hypothetical protein BL253_13425 [Pseudofrankia asymbiotica]|uniref:Mur ligase C-terminal domain-containing protein n=2 Tax=Pseudofrankia asymbiotica TaxID=1834516 RepID=A0A1V2IBK7_9ACTN|nr:hypothetical protein BL253_13425 [Pseudofrankia asymbiotica]
MAAACERGAARPVSRRRPGDRPGAVLLIGRQAGEIMTALARHAPDVPVERATGMDDAVEAAARPAGTGDTVLPASAAASLDMFHDCAERGDLIAAAASRRRARGTVTPER